MAKTTLHCRRFGIRLGRVGGFHGVGRGVDVDAPVVWGLNAGFDCVGV